MGMAMNMMIIFFCILFAMYLTVPGATSGLKDFIYALGEHDIEGMIVSAMNPSSILINAIAAIIGVVATIVGHDVMTGIVSYIAISLGGWAIIPTGFANIGIPAEFQLFITGLLAFIWGFAIISFFRGYEL